MGWARRSAAKHCHFGLAGDCELGGCIDVAWFFVVDDWAISSMKYLDSLFEAQTVLSDLKDSTAFMLNFDPAVARLAECLGANKTIFVCGNGGSHNQASHLSTEFVVRFKADRRALAAHTLGADVGLLTACANDYGYDQVFSREIDALGRPGDVLIGISTSGKSLNVNQAIRLARHKGLGTIGLSGAKGLESDPDIDLRIPSESVARIQELHLLVCHMLVEAVEATVPL